MHSADDVDALLKARAEIDEQLRKHKNALTVLFTDVVGSTSFFERNGDTAGLVMIHRHDELAARAIEQHGGKVIKTIGDSAMAEFPDPGSAVRSAVQIERDYLKLNLSLPEDQRAEVRIGVHTGVGFRKGNDLFGDVVNVTARIVKRTAPAQILISRATYEAVSKDNDLHCRWLNKLTIDGRTEKEDIFEVIWTDAEAYRDVQDRLASTSNIPPRYEVLSQIGAGGIGIVYKARDLETGEIVALKILKPEIASDPEAQENFKRELCLARKITHKNVCRIHEFSRSNGTAYASMELIEGETLSSRLYRAGALPLSDALEIARQISAGLREAHAQGIVHRDLKPANIMMDRAGNVKIMDFGIARMIQREGPMTGTIVGTPAYMSPEQAELKPVSSSTDIYALGLVLYEMITGVPAFSGDTPVAVALKQIRDYPKRPREIVPQLSRAIDTVIMKCLQKDPANRFQSADSFEAALVKAAKARPMRPWEVAVNRWMNRAELEVRTRLRQSAEIAKTSLEPQNLSAQPRIQEDPKAILGFAGLVGALSVFLFVGGWRPTPVNARTVDAAARNSNSPVALANGSAPLQASSPAGNSFVPAQPRQINLYENIKIDDMKAPSFDPASPAENPASKPAAPPDATAKPVQIAKLAKTPVRKDDRQARSIAKSSTQIEAPASPAQPESLTSDASTKSATQESAANSSELSAAPESPVGQTTAATLPKAAISEPNAPKLYVEVGTFKDETWANNAVEKLTELGFHAMVMHKNLLWIQSYRVQVGPFVNKEEMAEAQKNLASHGYKAHPVS